MKKISKFTLIIISISLTIWAWLNYPKSYNEAIFINKLSSFASSGRNYINISDITPFEWEIVCESNGYDEALYLEEFKKTYPIAGSPNDNSWGLLFIKKNGDYVSISSNCAAGVYLSFSKKVCIKKSEAILSRVESNKCNNYFVAQ